MRPDTNSINIGVGYFRTRCRIINPNKGFNRLKSSVLYSILFVENWSPDTYLNVSFVRWVRHLTREEAGQEGDGVNLAAG